MISFTCVSNLARQEFPQGRPAHHRRIDDLALLKRQPILEHGGTICGLKHDLHRATGSHHVRLFAAAKISLAHVCHVSLDLAGPVSHGMGIGLRVGLHRSSHTAIRVPLSKHRIDRAPQDLGIPRLDFLISLSVDVLRVVRNSVSVFLQFLDSGLQLGNRGTDIGQLDDVCSRGLGQLAQFGQRVILLLLITEMVGQIRDNPASQGNVLQLEFNPRRRGEGSQNRQQ